ncbi:MAG: hypothetical protein JSW07_20115 [bacterium]|nr:MAG: hypothetical protein JSW07_20115 [bacterium]
MAKAKSKGSIILEVLIVILAIALIATILYPKKIWEAEEGNIQNCRAHMDRIFKAEMIFLKYHNNYTDTLDQLISFFKGDTTKVTIREYFMADTALAETMTDYLKQSDLAADLVVRNLFADTLMYALIEAINYDSNLARVMLNRLEDTALGDTVRAKRNSGNNDVAILKELDKEFAGIEIYEPIKDDDSLSLVFNRMIPEVSTGSLLDSLYILSEDWAQEIDSAVFYTLDDFRYCPTANREYLIAVIDTSVIKYVNIECPIDSFDIEATKTNFVEYHLGHRRIENHGKIETGEKSWSR